ncbi:MAG: hypothetical protein K5663_04345 [Clostridiales bacterium]|nr:hypothetical protein [Clostridiales bacterium]
MICVVAKDGSGDFTSIQQAVDAMPVASNTPSIIILRMDEYRERVVIDKSDLRIVGEARDRTVITASACAKDQDADGKEKGTFLSSTVIVTGDNVEIENLTIRNDAGDGRQVGQAVALYAAGDRGVFRNLRLIAHQDTLFCGPLMEKVVKDIQGRRGRAQIVDSVCDCTPTFAREYFENCFIQGDVDFIFGPYRCWFEKCTLFMNRRGGWYTAANTPESQPHGFVFSDCALTGECGEGMAFLGRPWRKFARTAFVGCSMDACVAPQGFADWDGERRVTWRYQEYATTGENSGLEARHPSEKLLTSQEAGQLSLSNVIGGSDKWRPDRRVPTVFLAGDSICADKPLNEYPMRGWGQEISAFIPDEFIQNEARNGRSSKSFVAEKRLNFIELCLRKGDTLLIAFSHNDEKSDAERHTDARTTFPEYLNMYIDAALRQGARPVLITPMPRRRFDETGRLIPTHADYPDAIRALAIQRGVKLIDLEKTIALMLEAEGAVKSKQWYCHAPRGHCNYPEGIEDNSHLSQTGAAKTARIIAEALKEDR